MPCVLKREKGKSQSSKVLGAAEIHQGDKVEEGEAF